MLLMVFSKVCPLSRTQNPTRNDQPDWMIQMLIQRKKQAVGIAGRGHHQTAAGLGRIQWVKKPTLPRTIPVISMKRVG